MAGKDFKSSFEKEVNGFINTLGFDTRKTYIGGVNPGEIDIHIIGTNLYIECNGDYWYSQESIIQNRPNYTNEMVINYHKNKTDCVKKQKNGVLVHIFLDDWVHKRSIIEHFLRTNLLLNKEININECIIKPIDIDIALDFCEKNHILGSNITDNILSLGISHCDVIIGAAVFLHLKTN